MMKLGVCGQHIEELAAHVLAVTSIIIKLPSSRESLNGSTRICAFESGDAGHGDN